MGPVDPRPVLVLMALAALAMSAGFYCLFQAATH